MWMPIQGPQAELRAHAPTAVRPGLEVPSFQRAARAPLTGLPCANNFGSQAEAREQGRPQPLRKGRTRWLPVYQSLGCGALDSSGSPREVLGEQSLS